MVESKGNDVELAREFLLSASRKLADLIRCTETGSDHSDIAFPRKLLPAALERTDTPCGRPGWSGTSLGSKKRLRLIVVAESGSGC